METIKQIPEADDVDRLLQQSIKLSSENDHYYDDIPADIEVEVIEDTSCVLLFPGRLRMLPSG